MNTCSTCKHWELADVRYPRNHFVAAVKAGGFCGHDKIRENDFYTYRPTYEPDVMVYSYAEDGEFWTGPKFGCVHHEEKAGG